MGAVKHPGPYPVNGNTDRLTDLIARAGGFAPNAYPDGAQFFRDPNQLTTPSQDRFSPLIQRALQQVNTESYQREFAKSAVDKARALQGVSNSSSILPGLGGTSSGSPINVPSSVFDEKTVSPARPLTDEDLAPGGNINVDLPKALRHPSIPDNLVLLDGDIIVIPQRPTTVSVVGAVIAPSAVLFVPGKKIAFYTDRSGGYASDAARDGVLLIRYRGQVIRPISSTTVELGDIIWVPTKVIAAHLADKSSAIDTISRNLISGALMLAIIRGAFL